MYAWRKLNSFADTSLPCIGWPYWSRRLGTLADKLRRESMRGFSFWPRRVSWLATSCWSTSLSSGSIVARSFCLGTQGIGPGRADRKLENNVQKSIYLVPTQWFTLCRPGLISECRSRISQLLWSWLSRNVVLGAKSTKVKRFTKITEK